MNLTKLFETQAALDEHIMQEQGPGAEDLEKRSLSSMQREGLFQRKSASR
ncbi:hypothetical protein [Lysinibacillus sp. NPDC086135]